MAKANRMALVHSDIRGPLYEEALRMQHEGIPVVKLNTGNPAAFGFEMPESIRRALCENATSATAYCDLRGMPQAREALAGAYCGDGVKGAHPDRIYLGNGVSELVSLSLSVLLNPGDELLMPTPCYTLWSNCARLGRRYAPSTTAAMRAHIGSPIWTTCAPRSPRTRAASSSSIPTTPQAFYILNKFWSRSSPSHGKTISSSLRMKFTAAW